MKMENKKLSQYSTIDAYKTYVYMFVFMMIFYLGFYIIIGLMSNVHGVSSEEILTSKHIVYFQGLVSPLMFCALFFWQNRENKKQTFQMIGLNKKPNWKYILFAVIMSGACLLFFSGFSNLFDAVLGLVGFNPVDTLNLVRDNVGYLFLNLFVLSVLPAIFEELIFRGIVYNGLKSSHNSVFAIIVSAIMFSLMHGSLQQTLYQFIIGIVLAIVMFATENILYPIILHFCNNAVVIISDFFIVSEEVVVYEFSLINIIIPILLAIIGTILLIFIFKKVNRKRYEEQIASGRSVIIHKTFAMYSLSEKRFAICGFVIATVVWLSNTISMF